MAISPGAGAQRIPQTEKPNVVLILLDDIGYGDIGSYGVTDASTPNIDRLARQGVKLTDAYANASNCSPTRAGFITGQYQQRYGIEWPLGAVETDSSRGLRMTGASLPALLKNNGYRTGLVGKWHLGNKPEFGPLKHGFDEFFGFLSGAVDYYTHQTGDGTPDLYQDTTAVVTTTYLTDEITHRAVGFIDRNSRQPFFLEVAYNAVHWPFEPPGMAGAHHRANSGRPGDMSLYQGPGDPAAPTRRDYVRMLERADQGVGEILAALDKQGLAKNTLVIFTNDNGGEWLSRNAPLSNRKSTLWEGGIRVPLILRWPGVLPAGKVSSQVAITMDLTATILAATRTAVPATHKLEGIDLIPTLSGHTAIADRELFWRMTRPVPQRAVRFGRWKLFQDRVNYYLFDVAADPGERHDLTARYPEVVHQLIAKLDAWEKDVDSPNRELPRTQ
ncbi:MAG: sulfatase-like hydrolase/transferase, partial [Gemmatimonadaceae bacterium]